MNRHTTTLIEETPLKPAGLRAAATPLQDATTAETAHFRRLDELPQEALALLDQAEQQSIEFGTSWYRNLLGTVPGLNQQAHFHVLRCGAQVRAVLPVLVARESGLRGQELRALGNFYTALYAPALAPGVVAAELVPLVQALRRAHAPLASLRLEPMDPGSHPYGVLREALHLAGMRVHSFFAFGNWYLRPQTDWAAYLAERPGELRNTIKRMEKKLLKAGADIEIVDAGEGLERAISAYCEVYAASWKRPEPFPEFMPGLIRTCAQRGWLRLGVVWLDGKAIASQLWIVAHGKALIYKLAYDEAFKALGPGSVLTARLMQRAIDADKVEEIDYLIGDDPYKKSWMSHRRERWGLIAYNPRTLGGLLGAVRESTGRALKPLLQRLRRSDAATVPSTVA